MSKKYVQGSILNEVTATELVEERAKCDFDTKELSLLYSPQWIIDKVGEEVAVMKANEGYGNSHKYYEFSAEEVQQNWVRKLTIAKKLKPEGIVPEVNVEHLWFGIH